MIEVIIGTVSWLATIGFIAAIIAEAFTEGGRQARSRCVARIGALQKFNACAGKEKRLMGDDEVEIREIHR